LQQCHLVGESERDELESSLAKLGLSDGSLCFANVLDSVGMEGVVKLFFV